MNLLIHGASVVTALDPPAVERLDVEIEGDRIVATAPVLAIDAELIDATDCVVVPGNVNAHTHAYSALARGMPYQLAPPTNFLEILQRVWWRLDRALDHVSIRAAALVAGREALLAGTTTLFDHHASPTSISGSLDVLASVFAELGIRSVLAYEVSDRDGAERTADGIEENRRFLRDAWAGDWPLARGMVGAHASFTLSDETLADVVALCASEGAALHIHAVEDEIDRFAIERLMAAGALNGRSIVAHAVHATPTEASQLIDIGATIAHNPRSNMNNGVGRVPLSHLGERIALGTDGIGSDMWAEGQAGYLRRREERLNTTPEWAVRRLAVGQAAAGEAFREPLLGRIEPGAPADLVILDYAAPTPLDSQGLAGHWIFGMSAANVRDVIVNGEVVVRDRRLTRMDEDDLSDFAERQARQLWARLQDTRPHPFTRATRLGAAVAAGDRWPT